MAINQSNEPFTLTAGATFANSDLYKFVAVNSSGHAVIGPTTAAGNIVGTLDSVTATTAGAGVDPVSIRPLTGKSQLFLAASSLSAGNTIAASSNGMGIAPTTDAAALGVIATGSSGTTGRIATVVWIAAGAADV